MCPAVGLRKALSMQPLVGSGVVLRLWFRQGSRRRPEIGPRAWLYSDRVGVGLRFMVRDSVGIVVNVVGMGMAMVLLRLWSGLRSEVKVRVNTYVNIRARIRERGRFRAALGVGLGSRSELWLWLKLRL